MDVGSAEIGLFIGSLRRKRTARNVEWKCSICWCRRRSRFSYHYLFREKYDKIDNENSFAFVLQISLDYGLLAFLVTGSLFVVTSFMNTCSVPERNLSELKAAGEVPEFTSLSSTLISLVKIPTSTLKLGFMLCIMMALLIVPLVWFTHHYASIMYNATDATSTIYNTGIAQGTKMMILFPITSMVISGASIYFRILDRANLKYALFQFPLCNASDW